MPHSYTNQLMHYVWSTKERNKIIDANLREHLWPFIGGITRQNGMKALIVGGVEDHVHILLSLPANIAVSKAVQLIKGGSSKWVHETFPSHRNFAWQEGYGAFSLSISHVQDTISYIETQAAHHRKRTFKQEFLMFLQRHGIDYDERYVWG
ncbi:MAG TPA: IS200/IS605 family transposase [Pyrinomonadaceae bacterium]|nr:IS200/IS605 family transposase [Pyrinomonadaceae bacterium]